MGIVPVVLLVLGRMEAGIVGGYHHQPAGHAGVGGGEQGVRGHIQAHMLHGGQAAGPADGAADGDFQRDLLVAGPLGVDIVFIVCAQGFHDLGAGRAGIGGGDGHASLPGASGDGLVAGEYRFHRCIPPLCCVSAVGTGSGDGKPAPGRRAGQTPRWV